MIENSYLAQRRSLVSDYLLETFFDEAQTSESIIDKPADIMDDNDWNNNWKKRESDPIFKNAFFRWLLELD